MTGSWTFRSCKLRAPLLGMCQNQRPAVFLNSLFFNIVLFTCIPVLLVSPCRRGSVCCWMVVHVVGSSLVMYLH